jgi:hypothetical protein
MTNAVLAAGIAAIIGTSALGAVSGDFFLSPDGRMVVITRHAGAMTTRHFAHTPAASVIYSNLASKYPNGLYFAGQGAVVCGNCPPNGPSAVAAGFTPRGDVTAMRVEAALAYQAGTDSISISIFSDSNGAPGTALWSGVARNLPNVGVCCGVAKVAFAGGLKLKGGTQYWLVGSADRHEEDTLAVWSLATVDQIDEAPVASDLNNQGWRATVTTTPPAFAIYSK